MRHAWKTPNKKKMGKNPRKFIDIRGFFFQQFIIFFRGQKNPLMSHELEWEFFSRKKKKLEKNTHACPWNIRGYLPLLVYFI